MNLKNPNLLIIIISLIAAIIMVIGSNLFAGDDSGMTFIYWVIAIWWVPFSFLLHRANQKAQQSPSPHVDE